MKGETLRVFFGPAVEWRKLVQVKYFMGFLPEGDEGLAVRENGGSGERSTEVTSELIVCSYECRHIGCDNGLEVLILQLQGTNSVARNMHQQYSVGWKRRQQCKFLFGAILMLHDRFLCQAGKPFSRYVQIPHAALWKLGSCTQQQLQRAMYIMIYP